MNEQPMRERLEDVLDAYVASGGGPNSTSLADWIRRYPEFERELTEFAASWSLMKALPPSPDAEQVSEEVLVLRGMSVVENLLHQQRLAASTVATNPIQDLLTAGKACGLEPRELAQAAGLSILLVRKLDRRLIQFDSIPRPVIEALAATIQRGVGSVAQYLRQAPTFASGAQHRAEQPPRLPEPQDFFAAVRSDSTLAPELRAHLLALAPQDQDGNQ